MEVEGSEFQLQAADFEIKGTIVSNADSTIYLVQKKVGDDEGTYYALKKTKMLPFVIPRINMELKILRAIRRVSFTNTLVGEFTECGYSFFLTQYLPRGCLDDHLKSGKKFSRATTRFYGSELVTAVGELHRRLIVHANIAPNSIIFDYEGHVVLSDFEYGRMFSAHEDPTLSGNLGPVKYSPPENLHWQGKYTFCSDWWAVGVIIWELYFWAHPFESRSGMNMPYQVWDRIAKGKLSFPARITEDERDFFEKMLCYDSRERLGSNGSTEVKAHPFFRDVDWVKTAAYELEPPFLPPLKSTWNPMTNEVFIPAFFNENL